VFLKCCILSGKHAGYVAFIPRITLEPLKKSLPIPLSRHQFPVHIVFAMTINKSQVLFQKALRHHQTLNVVYPEVLLNVLPTPW